MWLEYVGKSHSLPAPYNLIQNLFRVVRFFIERVGHISCINNSFCLLLMQALTSTQKMSSPKQESEPFK